MRTDRVLHREGLPGLTLVEQHHRHAEQVRADGGIEGFRLPVHGQGFLGPLRAEEVLGEASVDVVPQPIEGNPSLDALDGLI
jgi:hypothetical protein